MIDTIPVWVLFIGTIILIVISIEAGYRLGDAAYKRSDAEKESPVSAISSIILGLLAFMLAFTFGIVSERYSTKRELVLADAIAIQTAWQRSDFLPASDRERAKDLFRKYVDLRITFAQTGILNQQDTTGIMTETKQIQKNLWDMAVVNARKDMNSDVAALYIDSLNGMTSVHTSRVAIGIFARIPVEIWFVLYCMTVLGMMSLGYQTAIAGSKRSSARPILAISFAMVFALIASLDRPASGIMRVSQKPLADLRDLMDAEKHKP